MKKDQAVAADNIELKRKIKVAVRALVIRDDQVLIQEKQYDDGEYRHVLPGGAIRTGEILADGLRRECFEELGVDIEILELVHVADYMKLRPSDPPTRRQQVEFFFRCRVPGNYQAGNGPKPDKRQTDIKWWPVDALGDLKLVPCDLHRIITGTAGDAVYLGRIT